MLQRSSGALLVCAVAAAGTALAQSWQIKLPGTGTFILHADAGQSLLRQCSRDAPANVSQFWDPSGEQIQKLELLLPKYVGNDAGQKLRIPGNVEYHRQYIGIVVNGKRLIYGNFYPADFPDYLDEKSRPVVVCDGGPAFWGIVFDPEANLFLDLKVNGSV
jgi:hypothetical protein